MKPMQDEQVGGPTLGNGIREVRFGELKVQCSVEGATISKSQATAMEKVLNKDWLPTAMSHYNRDYVPNYMMKKFGVPSLLVRFDMPPMLDEQFPGLYEVEANPAGLGLADSIGLNLPEQVAGALRRLGLSELAYGIMPSRERYAEEHRAAMASLEEQGIKVHELADRLNSDLPQWLRAGHEDLSKIEVEKQLLMPHHGGGHKEYLISISEAVRLSECRAPFADPRFKDGFVLKPWGGWGSRGVEVYAAKQPWKGNGSTVSQMARAIDDIWDRGTQDEYIIQRLLPPQPVGKGRFRNWRVFAVWTPEGYKVVGGYTNERPSLRLHGAGDTVWGAIHVSKD